MLVVHIDRCIAAGEAFHNVKLCDSDKELLRHSLVHFVDRAIDKFIRGAIQHNVPLSNRPCLKEMQDEIVDLFFYHAAHSKNLSNT